MDSKMIDIIIGIGQTTYMVFFSTLFAVILGFIPSNSINCYSTRWIKT